MNNIDLHIHTNYSDGTNTVEEVLKEAAKLELSSISITDHNTIDCYTELKNKNMRNIFPGRIIPGCEITTTYQGEIIEILGYGFSINKMKEQLKENVLSQEEIQAKEFLLILEAFQEKGVLLNPNHILFDPKLTSCRKSILKEIIQYKENSTFFLTEEGKTSSAKFSRNELFNPKSPLYVNMQSLFPSLEKTVSMIHKSNGFAFLAHTFIYSKSILKELENITSNYSLDGLECCYTTFTEEESRFLIDYTQKKELYQSGGSDFHGKNKINHNMGTGRGNLKMHMLRVAACGNIILDNWNGEEIKKETLLRILLMHDMGNIIKITPDQTENQDFLNYRQNWITQYGEDDHVVNNEIARREGFTKEEITIMDAKILKNNETTVISNSFLVKLCAYCDQRITPEGVSGIKERLEELKIRHQTKGRGSMSNPEIASRLIQRALEIEKQIMKFCTLSPEEITDETIKPYIQDLKNFEIIRSQEEIER